jgi:hypothetical protein
MNAEQLATYLINNDSEILIVRKAYDDIAENLEAEGIEATRDEIVQAVEIALEDPYIAEFYADKFAS